MTFIDPAHSVQTAPLPFGGAVVPGEPKPSAATYTVDQLANGIRVVSVPMPHLHSAELVCYMAVGGRCEQPSQVGISHFLEHMIFRGTAEYADSTALERAFEALGGAVNAATDAETTCFHSRIHPRHLAEGVALFGSMLRRPKFAQIDTERRIIIEEAREDYNEEGVQINPDNLMVGLLWPDQPLGQPLAGTPEILQQIDLATLKQYYQRWYQPQNLVICAAGAVERSELLAAVEAQFGDWCAGESSWPVAALAAETEQAQLLWVEDSASQVNLQLAFPLPGRNDPQTVPLRVLRRVLAWGGGARLTLRLREQLGLTYAIDAHVAMFDDCGYLAIDLAVAPENLSRAIAEIMAVLKQLREQPLPETELSDVIRGYLYDLDFSCDQAESMTVRYGWGVQAGYLRTLAEDREDLKALTAAEVQQVAQQFLQPQALKLVVVGPWTAKERRKVEKMMENY